MGLFDKGPDAGEILRAQKSANSGAAREAASLAAVDQFSPFGSTTFTRGEGGAPTAQTISLSPEVQRIIQSRFGVSEGLSDQALNLIDQLPTDLLNIADVGTGDEVTQALFDKRMALLNPEIERAGEELNVNLARRGIPIRSEISDFERGRFDDSRFQAIDQVAKDAVLAGGAEQDRLLRNALGLRNNNLNEIMAMVSGTPNVTTPSFAATAAPNVAAPNVAAAHQAANAMNPFSAQNMKSGIGSVIKGGTGFGLGAFG